MEGMTRGPRQARESRGKKAEKKEPSAKRAGNWRSNLVRGEAGPGLRTQDEGESMHVLGIRLEWGITTNERAPLN